MSKLHAFSEGAELKKHTPSTVMLLKFGENKFTRNNKQQSFDVTPEDGDVIIQEFSERSKDLVFDFGHSSLDKQAIFEGNAPAAGYCNKLEKTEDGILGHVSKWTTKGTQRIEDGEYNYYSPVLFFDEKTHRPNAMHSVAITNTPAIHGSQKLVAASDFWEGEKMEETKKTIESRYKDLATQIVANIRDAKTELNDVMLSLSDSFEDDKDVKAEMEAFSSELFKEDLEAVEAFGDLGGQYEALKDAPLATKLQYLNKEKLRLDVAIQQAKDNAKIGLLNQLSMIETEIKLLQAEPKEAVVAVVSKPAPFSDILIDTLKENNTVAFSDTGITEKEVVKELKSLYEFKNSTMLALSDVGAGSLDSLSEVIKKVNDNALDVEARGFVYKCMAEPDCKITEALQDWAVDFYKRDKDGFKKHVANAPVAFSQSPPTLAPNNKHIAKCSDSQREMALIFNNDPETTYQN